MFNIGDRVKVVRPPVLELIGAMVIDEEATIIEIDEETKERTKDITLDIYQIEFDDKDLEPIFRGLIYAENMLEKIDG